MSPTSPIGNSLSVPDTMSGIGAGMTIATPKDVVKANSLLSTQTAITAGAPITATQNTALGTSKPAPVVSSSTATNDVNNNISTTVTQAQTDIANQKALQDAAAIKAQQDAATTKAASDAAALEKSKQTPTDAQTLASQPEAGYQFVYDKATGAQTQIPVGTAPSSNQTMTDVNNASGLQTVQTGTSEIRAFGGNDYGMYDTATGKYLGAASATDFANAKGAQQATKDLESIKAGTYPLTAGQQSQIDSIKNTYQTLIDAQKVENSNVTGNMAGLQNLFGMGGSSVSISAINKVISDGAQKIADLNTKMTDAVNAMTSALQKDNVSLIQTLFNDYQNGVDAKQKVIDGMKNDVQAAADKQDLKTQAYALSMAGKYQDTTELISQYDSQAEVDRKVQTSQIWQANKEKALGNIDPVALKTMVDAYRVTGKVPLFRGTNASKQIESFWAAVGNAPGTVSDAVKNQIALKSLSSARDTMQKIGSQTKVAVQAMEGGIKLAQNYSNKLDRSGSPIVNNYLLKLQGKLGAADPQTVADVNAFDAAITTVSQEYAKIMTGAAASVAGTTISSQADAKEFINKELTKVGFDEVVKLLRQDAQIRTDSYDTGLNTIDSSVNAITSTAAAGGSGTTTSNTSTSGGSGFGWGGK